MKILVINGPNLQLLGTRDPDVYGAANLTEINEELSEKAKKKSVEIDFFQSNHEGIIIDRITAARNESVDIIIINPAAYTHTSIAIRDALVALDIPAIEVHLSNIYSREKFRHKSLIAPVCVGQISGFGKQSYLLALDAAIAYLESL